jgi:hypothetical protein
MHPQTEVSVFFKGIKDSTLRVIDIFDFLFVLRDSFELLLDVEASATEGTF